MRLRLLHRRLALVMALAALVAFLAGTGLDAPAAVPALVALVAGLFWQPAPALGRRLERLGVALAVALAARATYHVAALPEDVVIPMADLLLLLLAMESIKSLESGTDTRIYALSFALLIASTAYRPGVLFALAFIAYVAAVILALIVGQLRRQSERHGAAELPLTRGFLLRMAALSGPVVAMSAVLFLAFPRVSRGWAARVHHAETIVGFDEQVSLAAYGSRIYPNPEIVLRVEFPDGRPADPAHLYWRGRSYDRFDGVRWSRSADLPRALAPSGWYWQRWGGPVQRQDIYAVPLEAQVLFGLHPMVRLVPHGPIRPSLDNAGDVTYVGSGEPVYTAFSLAGRPTPSALRLAPDGAPPADGYYLRLPGLPARVKRLADSLTAGASDRYDRVEAVRSWLRTRFGYTLELPRTPREATLDYFLFERRRGHCEYFSTALAVLLREEGIPARNVNGFAGGEWNQLGDYLAVTQNHAHSWVEVWFPGFGWVPFDATPAAAGATAAAAGGWLWPLRFGFDALEHRWGKWVLDYDLADQFRLVRRATAAFRRAPSDAPAGGGWPDRLLPWVLGAAAALVLFWALRFRRRGLPEASRLYLRLRRSYGRAGFETGGQATPPLAFLARLSAAGAPGLPNARVAVGLYLRARFRGDPIGAEGLGRMRAEVAAARRALRAGRRGAAGARGAA